MHNKFKHLRNFKKELLFGIGLLASVFSLWLIFHTITFSDLKLSLKEPNYLWIIPNLIFGLLAMLQQAYRWRTLISPIQQINISRLFAATSIGLLANNILPFRLGEYVRVISLSKQNKDIPHASLFATVLVERLIFDLSFLIIICMGVLYYLPIDLGLQLRTALLLSLCLIAILIVIILSAVSKPAILINITLKILFFLSPKHQQSISNSINRFVNGLIILKNIKIIILGMCQTALIWLFMALSIFCLFKSFGFELPFTASFVMITIISMAIFVPSMPGNIGIYHLAVVLTLSAYNITGADARAFSIVVHLSQFLPTTILGFYFLHRTHISVRTMHKKVSENINMK